MSFHLVSSRAVLLQVPRLVIGFSQPGEERVSHLDKAGSIVINPEPLLLVWWPVHVPVDKPGVLGNKGSKLQLGQEVFNELNDGFNIGLSDDSKLCQPYLKVVISLTVLLELLHPGIRRTLVDMSGQVVNPAPKSLAGLVGVEQT